MVAREKKRTEQCSGEYIVHCNNRAQSRWASKCESCMFDYSLDFFRTLFFIFMFSLFLPILAVVYAAHNRITKQRLRERIWEPSLYLESRVLIGVSIRHFVKLKSKAIRVSSLLAIIGCMKEMKRRKCLEQNNILNTSIYSLITIDCIEYIF